MYRRGSRSRITILPFPTLSSKCRFVSNDRTSLFVNVQGRVDKRVTVIEAAVYKHIIRTTVAQTRNWEHQSFPLFWSMQRERERGEEREREIPSRNVSLLHPRGKVSWYPANEFDKPGNSIDAAPNISVEETICKHGVKTRYCIILRLILPTSTRPPLNYGRMKVVLSRKRVLVWRAWRCRGSN